MAAIAVGDAGRFARKAAMKVAAGLSILVGSGLLPAGLPDSLAAQASCTPDAGLSQCTRFSFSGADQTFVVPEGVTSLDVKLWGAGGGGSPFGSTGLGGGGGYAGGTLTVTPGSTLTVVVGEGGNPRSLTPTYGGGGAGGNDSSSGNYDGASGGGRSALRDGGTELITAAGGGGASGATASNGGTAFVISFAGAGGQDADYSSGCRPGAAATAGTQVAGGSGGAGRRPGEDGSSLQGGAGGFTNAANTGAGGGGGGGFFGGGGGAAQFVALTCSGISAERGQEGGGAGGSSYLSPLVTGGSIVAGDRQSAANTGDGQHIAGVADGGSRSLPGGDGLVVLQWNDPAVSLSIDKTATLNDLNANALIDLGETISYSFLVTNTGAVTLTGVTVDDPMLADAGIAVAPGPQTLAPGASVTFTATYTPDQDDIDFGSVVNSATATGTRSSGALVRSAPDTDTAPPSPPRVALAKSGVFNDVDGNGFANAGDTLVYTFTVTNTGARTLTGVRPVDAGPTFNGVAGENALSAMTPNSVTLAPGAAQTFMATYTMTQGDADRGSGIANGINNTARASGQSSGVTILSNIATVALTLPARQATGIVLTKQALRRQVRIGETVPYIIRVINNSDVLVGGAVLTDRLPAGFRFVEGSATIDGVATTPSVSGRSLTFAEMTLLPASERVIRLETLVLSSAGPGRHVNRATLTDSAGSPLAADATATVEIVAEPVFDCSEVIGRVFDDRNRNGYHDKGEPGLPGVRLATVNGELITTDAHGRFSVPCAALPDQRIGSNFILKLDTRTLPTGYRLTTENPRVVRLTAGKMTKLNFGASVGRVVRLDLQDAAFEPDLADLRPEWERGIDQVIALLSQEQSVLRLTYIEAGGDPDLARARLKNLQALIAKRWRAASGRYRLDIEMRVETGR